MENQTDCEPKDEMNERIEKEDSLTRTESSDEDNESYDQFANGQTPDVDSEDDTYIDINEILKSQLKNIYQIQINNESIIIKHIGVGSHVPDMIIKEAFGKNNNLNLYNCVYMESEIEFLKSELSNDKFLPIVKLVEKSDSETKIYSISIKVNELIEFNKPYTNFNVYLTYTSSTYVESLYKLDLDKDINSSNIIEKMLETIIELGLTIL
jgi:hypothetical protein